MQRRKLNTTAVALGLILVLSPAIIASEDQAAAGPVPVNALAGFGPIISVEASSQDGPVWAAENVIDWNWRSRWRARGETEGAWVQLNFAGPQRVGAVQVVDRPNEKGEVAAIRLSFSDGSSVDYRLAPHTNYPGLDQPGTIYTPVDEHILADYAKKAAEIGHTTDQYAYPVGTVDSNTVGVVHAWDAHAYPLEYARSKGPFFIRFEPRQTTFVRVTVTAMVEKGRPVGEPFAATLAFVRPVIIPDDAQPLATEEQVAWAGKKGFGLTGGPAEKPWTLENEEFRLEISNQSGLITRFTSRLPEPVDLCADAPEKPATVLYLQCIDRDWVDRFDRLLSWRRQDGSEGGETYQELECVIAPARKAVATATVRYRLYPDRLEQKLRFDYLVQDWARYRMGVYYEADTKQWPEHRDSGGWNPTGLAYVKAYSHAYDICWEQGDWHVLMWPLDVLRRDDRYLVWGSFDLQGPHLVMGPHIPAPGAYPSVYYMPLYLNRGDSYTLDLFWKSFPRPQNAYSDVLNWYGRRTYFDDPELAGIPVRLTQERPRTLPGGGRLAPSVRPGYTFDSEKYLQDVEAAMVKAGVRHVVYGGWDIWTNPPENITQESEWGADVGTLSTEKAQQDILASRQSGLRSYIYINNFCKPPWRGGEIVDPDNPEDREWYLERFKSFYSILKPDGVFWDTGWHPISWAPPNMWISSNPRGDELKGWLKIYALIYDWVKTNYPDSYVISGAPAAPTAYFCDAVHTEGDGIDLAQVAEDSKAFMQSLLAYWIPPYHDMGLAVLNEHNLKQLDMVDTGMPREVEEEIWRRWMSRGLKAVGLGRSLITQGEILLEPETVKRRTAFPPWRGWAYFMPQTQQVPELDRFCARATAVPLVWEGRCLTTEDPQTLGSVWAGKQEMLVSLYREGDQPATVRARIDRRLLNEYGFAEPGDKPEICVLGPLGLNQPGRTLEYAVEKDAILLSGELRAGELAIVFWPRNQSHE